jgi:hypothetical protein
MDLIRRLRGAAPPRVDRAALRDEMSRTDPDFAHVRRVQHDAMQALTAKRLQDGLAIRRERQFWERAGR